MPGELAAFQAAAPAQSATAVGAANQATWFPPVHVAPQRQANLRQANVGSDTPTASLSNHYPGVFDPDPRSAQPVAGRSTSRAESARPAQNIAAGRAATSSRSASGVAERPAARPNQPRQVRPNPQTLDQRGMRNVTNRPVNYQEPADPILPSVPAEKSGADIEVRRAFVAETGPDAIPPEPIPGRTATTRGNSRGEFTRTPLNPPPAEPLSAEFAELEQPLQEFAQTPADQPAGEWRGRANAAGTSQLRDSSVLDNKPSLPGWQTQPGSRSIPSRPAAAGRNREAEGGFDSTPRNFAPEMGEDIPEISVDSFEPESTQDLDNLPRPQKTLSCDELRERLLSEPLNEIALDVSPPLPERGDLPRLPSGDWVDHNGQLLAKGQMVALSRGYVIVDTPQGRRKISVARLGDASLALVASAWQIPGECAIGSGEYSGRCWTPQLSTWYASNVCHKPLYFEQVQLERYGHSAGPLMGPIRSSAHFFGSLVFWPYHSAIHPANECIYPLGYYRPGNCAPWLVEPFPFSGPGVIRQGAAVTGAAFIF